jgi:hypothetical protein
MVLYNFLISYGEADRIFEEKYRFIPVLCHILLKSTQRHPDTPHYNGTHIINGGVWLLFCPPTISNRCFIELISVMFTRVLNPSRCNFLAFTSRSLQTRRNPGARVPFVENYRNNWPETENILPEHVPEPILPPRTVSDSCLRFKLTSTFDHGSSIFYPHLSTHPADLKVTLKVMFSFLLSISSPLTIYNK